MNDGTAAQPRRRLPRITIVAAAILVAAPAFARAETVLKPKGTRPNDLYIVRMADNPVVAYTGGVPGLRATRPQPGTKIDPNSPAVVAYVRYLDARHDAAVGAVNGRKVYDYRFSFNGFAARLNAAQAAALAKVPGVLSVEKDQVYQADTSSTPAFLGLTAPNGLWETLGGVTAAGEDVIIGIIDSGIWPESPSFSDRVDGKRAYQRIPGWHGRCVPGEGFDASMCNQKLIGAQYFNAGQGGNAGVDADLPWEFNSVRDYNGHGTHTASTAGGNTGVATGGDTAVFGPISGMAPRARIAAYKALWSTEDSSTATGNTTDLLAAIDQAVADGVDVINYSVSGSQTNFRDAVEIAFLNAASVGVFVAASAGNSGPTVSTVAHPSPWITTVAAGTHNRNGSGSVTLGDGTTYVGASFADAVPATPLVDAANAEIAGATPGDGELCAPGALDPAVVTGKVVLCKRGVYALVDKSLAVLEAGGTGMVLYNDPASAATNTLALLHSVPSVHVVAASGVAIKAYIAAAAAPTASIAEATILFDVAAPFTASFSSRGPLRASFDLLKPDVIAPGQDILAAVAPPGSGGRNFDFNSGTSMSSPHVAGLAALLKQLRPDWSPMAIKSALMTSAGDVLDGPNTNPLLIFRQGAGHVAPNRAADPGLVYDSGFVQWLGFLCGTQLPTSFCTSAGVPVLDPSDLNTASIAIGDLAGVQTVTRTVRNVGSSAATYAVSTTGLAGFTVSVSPSTITLAPGQAQTFTVSFTRVSAALNTYTGGQLTWSDGTHSVRSPVVVRPVALAAPAEVSASYDVVFGYTGPFTASPRGLVPAATDDGAVADDPTDTFVPGGPGTVSFDVTIPAGSTYARFALFDADVSPASDLDLYVTNAAGQLVAASGGGTSQEEASILNPPPGDYKVWVHGWAVGATPANFTLYSWVLGTADAGNMTASAPATATTGGTGTVTLEFSGLAPATKYLGSIAYGGADGMPNPTIVRVDAP